MQNVETWTTFPIVKWLILKNNIAIVLYGHLSRKPTKMNNYLTTYLTCSLKRYLTMFCLVEMTFFSKIWHYNHPNRHLTQKKGQFSTYSPTFLAKKIRKYLTMFCLIKITFSVTALYMCTTPILQIYQKQYSFVYFLVRN